MFSQGAEVIEARKYIDQLRDESVQKIEHERKGLASKIRSLLIAAEGQNLREKLLELVEELEPSQSNEQS